MTRPPSSLLLVIGSAATAERLSAAYTSAGIPARAAVVIAQRPLPPAPLDAALARLDEFTDLIVTSKIAARILGERMQSLGLSQSALSGLHLWAVGPESATALRESARATTIAVPVGHDAEALVRAIGDPAGRRFLFPRAREGRDVLQRALGDTLHSVDVYETVPLPAEPVLSELRSGDHRAVLFCSPSAVDALHPGEGPEAFRSLLSGSACLALGPATAAALSQYGVSVVILRDTLPETISALLRQDAVE